MSLVKLAQKEAEKAARIQEELELANFKVKQYERMIGDLGNKPEISHCDTCGLMMPSDAYEDIWRRCGECEDLMGCSHCITTDICDGCEECKCEPDKLDDRVCDTCYTTICSSCRSGYFTHNADVVCCEKCTPDDTKMQFRWFN